MMFVFKLVEDKLTANFNEIFILARWSMLVKQLHTRFSLNIIF